MIHFRTLCISGHLNSLCRRLDELTKGSFKLVYMTENLGAMRRRIGWQMGADYPAEKDSPELRVEAATVDVLLDMFRELDIFEMRSKAGLKTFFAGERWFKPVGLEVGIARWRWRVGIPGSIRMLVPSYWKMAKRFAKLMDDPNFHVLPVGVHAARDLIKVYNVMHGKISYLWRTPKNTIERKLGGSVEGFPRMRLWAYFVPSSASAPQTSRTLQPSRALRVLWAGRMLGWKRVDILVKAVRRVVESGTRKIMLTLIGEGPARAHLEKLAGGVDYITFSPYVKNDELRKLMREADLYVMPSDGEEGWGAAVSEALAEGCPVISTFEAGSSATLLPHNHLYHADSVEELVKKLSVFNGAGPVLFDAESWSGAQAAELLMRMAES